MSDIDFDELDRAVASVLDGRAAPAASPAPGTPVSPVTPAPSVTPLSASLSAQALHAQPVKPVQRGRFLDMVHPAGDMTAPLAPALASKPVPPVSNAAFVSDVVAAPSPVAVPASITVPPQVPVIPTGPTVSPPAAGAPAPTPAPTSEADFFAASPDDAGPDKGLEIPVSPFIPDAKVDKRPLGAFAGSGTSATAVSDVQSQLLEVEKEDNIVEAEAALKASPAPTAPEAVAPEAPKRRFSLFGKRDKAVKIDAGDHTALDDRLPKSGKGTLIWVTVGIAVMLIGFGVGASLISYVQGLH